MTSRYSPQYTNAYEILTALGYRFSLDFDDEVLIDAPAELDREAVEREMQKALYGIQCRLRCSRRNTQRVFVGGALAGQQHDGSLGLDGWKYVRVGHAKWLCYRCQMVALPGIGFVPSDDPRLFFKGVASSLKNAKRRRYVEEPRT